MSILAEIYHKELGLAKERIATLERERDAYKKAKEENDERFMTERDALRIENDKLRAEVERLKC